MLFDAPLHRGRLLRRYKRFLADVMLDDGREVTAHCANPGAMLGLADPGLGVWLEPTCDRRRRLSWSWRLAELPGGRLAGIDTGLPNRLVAEALARDAIPELAGHAWRREVRYGAASRVDFLGTGPGGAETWLEVKNVHLRRGGDLAEFPDCVTVRGTRHLRELAAMAAAGRRAVMLYVIQRDDCGRFGLAADLDPAYAAAFAAARAAGVEALAYATTLSTSGISLHGPVPLEPGLEAAAAAPAEPRRRRA
jgi:sugar fermentation stimulation protein A